MAEAIGVRGLRLGFVLALVAAGPLLLGAGCSEDPYTIIKAPPKADSGPRVDAAPRRDIGVVQPDKGPGCKKRAGGEICNGKDDDCNGTIDDVPASKLQTDVRNCGKCGKACSYDNGFPKCKAGVCELDRCAPGFYDVNKKASDGCEYRCQPTNGGKEICDAADNDCDGKIDEDFDFTKDVLHCGKCGQKCLFNNAGASCKASACVMGACTAGFKDLNKDVKDGCEYACPVWPPVAETCNGKDDDCDARVDEGITGAGTVCDTGKKGICRLGKWQCLGGKATCVADLTAATEICNGKDDDCDGKTDEGFDTKTDPLNCGRCGRICTYKNAVPRCASGSCELARCIAGFVDLNRDPKDGCEHKCAVWPPALERCDGKDNDCDTKVDEDFDLTTDPKNCGKCGNVCSFTNASALCVASGCRMGACNRDFYDIDGKSSNGCEYFCVKTNGGVERCDGVDNDCDGKVDEDFDTTRDVNNCGGCGIRCGFSGAAATCVASKCVMGACKAGFKDLDGLTANGCEYACPVWPPAASDGCDGKDNDCDGKTDEDFTPAACGSSTGECVAGKTACIGGSTFCQGKTGPVPEKCNNKDDDCDGTIDNGFDKNNDPRFCGKACTRCSLPNAVSICTKGVCEVGVCKRGWVDLDKSKPGCEYACTITGFEVCDGIDNDCNGKVDDGLGSAPGLCKSKGPCAGATATCRGKDGWVCSYGSGVELQPCTSSLDCGGGTCSGGRCLGRVIVDERLCDGKDGDCDGVVDDPFKQPALRTALGKSCDPTGKKGECKDKGVYVCSAAGTSTTCKLTVAGASPRSELCNGKDDDCDGVVDNNVTDEQWVKVGGFEIFKYEASRPDATATSAGIKSSGRPCSVAGRLPWTNVSKEDALAACRRAGARLCPVLEWQAACRGPSATLFPYGNSFSPTTCNGQAYDTRPATSVNEDEALPTDKPSGCVSRWSTGTIFDMSGNVKEWIVEGYRGSTPTGYAIQGGAYDTPSLGTRGDGLSCTYKVPAPSATLRLPSLGFRCCR